MQPPPDRLPADWDDRVRAAYGVEILNEWGGRESPDVLIEFWESLDIFVE